MMCLLWFNFPVGLYYIMYTYIVNYNSLIIIKKNDNSDFKSMILLSHLIIIIIIIVSFYKL